MIGSVSYMRKNECVIHVLWECPVLASFPGAQRRPGYEASPVYDTIRKTFMEDLDNLLGGSLEEFSALNNFKGTGFVLGCENCERYDFKAL